MSPKEEQEFSYNKIEKHFYHDQTTSKNPLRKWFHLERYRIANSLVKGAYREGAKILDLGTGSCDWNADHLDVFGVDVNEELLKFGKEKNRLSGYKIAEGAATGLPPSSFDIITAFEFLEHIKDYDKVIKEAGRLLKAGGFCIVSVPCDVFFSLWRPLFFLQVLLHGYILRDVYYLNRCGHINHFSVETLQSAFLKEGFDIDLVFNMRRMTIFLCARKKMRSEFPVYEYADTTIILPTLNEARNITNILSYIANTYRHSNIIISDDGSKDNTKDLALRFNYERLVFLDRSGKEIHGLTASVVDAVPLVKTKYFVVIDADGQHPPKKINEIINILRLGSKLVVASRVEVEKEWGILRKLISYAGTALGKISLLLRGKKYLSFDVLGGFFGCDTDFWNQCASHEFKERHFRLRGYKVLFDFLKYASQNIDIEEVYYKFETRKSGISKINLKIYFEFLISCLSP